MNIGTGKDLEEYQTIPYHLINICNPGEKYHLGRFISDFQIAKKDIHSRGKTVILCGGTGLYLQAAIQGGKYIQIPSQIGFKESLYQYSEEELRNILNNYEKPDDLFIDYSTKKRMIRGIEILEWLKTNTPSPRKTEELDHVIIGLDPNLNLRRQKISNRLKQRIDQGMIQEVTSLLAKGISHDELQYYGLEYKYISLYLLKELDYESFYQKLETEIHRYAKRQMTFFRKMEKDGLDINWIKF